MKNKELKLFTIKPLRLYFAVALSLNFIALALECTFRYLVRWGWPYNSPVLNNAPMTDIAFAIPLFKHLHTKAFFDPSCPVPFMYPAPLAPLFGLFLALPHPLRFAEYTLAALLLSFALGFGIFLRSKGLKTWQGLAIALGALALSYPALFELKQGNMEPFVCLLIGFGIWCFAREHFHSAAVCFGAAASMKLFPLVYLGLFLSHRRYSPILTATVSASVLTLASLLYIGPTLPSAWHGISANLHFYQETVPTILRREVGYDHSLFALIKVSVHNLLHHRRSGEHFGKLLHIFMPVVGLCGFVLYVVRIQFLPFTNQVLCFCVASILLVPTSYDYTLLNLYIPWAMLVLLALRSAGATVPGLQAAFVCLALLTSIQTEFIYRQRTFGGQFKALVLLALFVIAFRFPFRHSPRVAGGFSKEELNWC